MLSQLLDKLLLNLTNNNEEAHNADSGIYSHTQMTIRLLVELIINILSDGKVNVSSNDAMGNSLSNGSIETF